MNSGSGFRESEAFGPKYLVNGFREQTAPSATPTRSVVLVSFIHLVAGRPTAPFGLTLAVPLEDPAVPDDHPAELGADDRGGVVEATPVGDPVQRQVVVGGDPQKWAALLSGGECTLVSVSVFNRNAR